jgi:hypothetical protein
VLIDARLDLDRKFLFYRLAPHHEYAYTTHGMSPEALLDTYQRHCKMPPPPTYMLALGAVRFGLGQPPSTEARQNLDAAFKFCETLFASDDLSALSLHVDNPKTRSTRA